MLGRFESERVTLEQITATGLGFLSTSSMLAATIRLKKTDKRSALVDSTDYSGRCFDLTGCPFLR